LEDKRGIARAYDEFFSARGVKFVREPKDSRSNYWLCAVLLENRAERDGFLEAMNSEGISCRPLWRLMSRLDIFKECRKGDLANSEWIEDRLVNVPSGVRGRA
jgi:perosamine synthetase